ncbi:MAG: hypothetical protein H6813_04350 [Phycisphaeraceae bacterium]|nr:hypothetical protein [Phycisphaeraceae bacterium]MCB9847179.1 hypothetical protein [Phycisphaeraceae bacterium]
MSDPQDKVGLARSVGRFWGHVLRGVKADVRKERQEVRRETEVRENVETPMGKATLRRTVVEEIEFNGTAEKAD